MRRRPTRISLRHPHHPSLGVRCSARVQSGGVPNGNANVEAGLIGRQIFRRVSGITPSGAV